MGLYSEGLIIGKIFASEIWGAYFREGSFIYLFFWEGGGGGLLSEFYGYIIEFANDKGLYGNLVSH